MAACQEHDENQIYGCFMVPLDWHPFRATDDGVQAQLIRRSWRSSWRLRLVFWPALRQKKRAA